MREQETGGFRPACSEYFKQNVHLSDALELLAELTQRIPPKELQLVRRYGLYASRTTGRWNEVPWVAERAPEGWRATHQRGVAVEDLSYEPLSDGDEEVTVDAQKRAWVQRFAKRYRKPEGPNCSRRCMNSIRWYVPGCMCEQVLKGPTSGSAEPTSKLSRSSRSPTS
jgi:hypothetical protein